MTFPALLIALRTAGIRLHLEGTALAWRGPKAAMTSDMLAGLKQHKPTLVTWIRHGVYACPVPDQPTPMRTALQGELARRPWLSEEQLWECWALFGWYADDASTERRAFNVVAGNLRLMDAQRMQRGAA